MVSRVTFFRPGSSGSSAISTSARFKYGSASNTRSSCSSSPENSICEAEPYLNRALILIEDEPMEPGVKKVTRTTIQNTLKEIATLKSQGPGASSQGG